MLAQQASGYDFGGHNFHIQEQPMHENLNFFHVGTDQSAKPTDQVDLVDSPAVVAKSDWRTALVNQANSSKSAQPT